MGTLTLAAITLVVLVLIGAAAVLIMRRRDGSYGRMPLSLDDPALSGPPAATGLSEVYELARRGNKIEAIRRYRELTGAGLKEAKDFVDAMPLAAPPNLPSLARAATADANLAAPDRAEVAALLAGGNKIAAIKRLRELTGWGLKEAKEYVDAMPLTGATAPPIVGAPTTPGPELSEVYELARRGNKIAAIKRYRELTGVGLKEAKDFVDRL